MSKQLLYENIWRISNKENDALTFEHNWCLAPVDSHLWDSSVVAAVAADRLACRNRRDRLLQAESVAPAPTAEENEPRPKARRPMSVFLPSLMASRSHILYYKRKRKLCWLRRWQLPVLCGCPLQSWREWQIDSYTQLGRTPLHFGCSPFVTAPSFTSDWEMGDVIHERISRRVAIKFIDF